jgi:hypothetical protein
VEERGVNVTEKQNFDCIEGWRQGTRLHSLERHGILQYNMNGYITRLPIVEERGVNVTEKQNFDC